MNWNHDKQHRAWIHNLDKDKVWRIKTSCIKIKTEDSYRCRGAIGSAEEICNPQIVINNKMLKLDHFIQAGITHIKDITYEVHVMPGFFARFLYNIIYSREQFRYKY
jgi:hypothetical protein